MRSSFKRAMLEEQPLQVVGVVNAYAAIQARHVGFKSIYLSGSGVATASYGLPDLGMTSLADVLVDVNRICAVSDLPLLVDCDTGWGGALSIARTIIEMERAGAAGVHIEDQVQEKRCGHLPGKQIVSSDEMCDRLKAAVDARYESEFVIVARTDALASETMSEVIDRATAYIESGADVIFLEAVKEIEQYSVLKKSVNVPILANITEFGVTPLFTLDQLRAAGVDIALYPLSAFRAMSKAAESAYAEIREKGSQIGILDAMQTRAELYENIEYDAYQQRVDAILESRSG